MGLSVTCLSDDISGNLFIPETLGNDSVVKLFGEQAWGSESRAPWTAVCGTGHYGNIGCRNGFRAPWKAVCVTGLLW